MYDIMGLGIAPRSVKSRVGRHTRNHVRPVHYCQISWQHRQYLQDRLKQNLTKNL